MKSSNYIKDNASSLGIHKNDPNVFRPVQTEGGIKYTSEHRYYYSDFGHETQSTSSFDGAALRSIDPAKNHNRIAELQYLIALTKRDIASCTDILERLKLDKYLADLERKLKRLISFDLRENKKFCSRLVALSNMAKLRNFQQKQLLRAKREYEKSLTLANLCPHCQKPLRVEKRQVVEILATKRQKDLIRNSIGRKFELAVCELVSFEMDLLAKQTWQSLADLGLQKRKLRFRHVKITTLEIAEVKSHYRAFQFTDKDGNIKFYYGFIDGTKYENGLLCPMKIVRDKFGKDTYYTIPDMIKLDGIAAESYKVRDIKCECKYD